MVGQIWAREICMRVGGTVQNTLKGGGTEKRGGDRKILKYGRQAGSRGGCLKKEGAATILQAMVHQHHQNETMILF